MAGKVFRGIESVGNISGATAESDRVQMRRDISLIQTLYPRVLGNGRVMSWDAKHVEDIIAGNALGDTTANTLRAMEEAKSTVNRMRGAREGILGGTPGAPAPAAPPPAEIDWNAFPKAD